MWILEEIEDLGKLYASLPDMDIDEYITSEMREAMFNEGANTIAYFNLRNYMIVPKHTRPRKTIRCVRLLDQDFNAGKWLESIIEQLTYVQSGFDIHMGFSFIAMKGYNTNINFL